MHVRQRLGASERHACHVLGQPRSTQRRVKKLPGDEEALRTDVIRLASRFVGSEAPNLERLDRQLEIVDGTSRGGEMEDTV